MGVGEVRKLFQAQGMALPESGGWRELASLEELRGSWSIHGWRGGEKCVCGGVVGSVTAREEPERAGGAQHTQGLAHPPLSGVVMGGSHWRVKQGSDLIRVVFF